MNVEDGCRGGATARVFSSIQPRACAAIVAGLDLCGSNSAMTEQPEEIQHRDTENRTSVRSAPIDFSVPLRVSVLHRTYALAKEAQSSPCNGPNASTLPDSMSLARTGG